MRGPVGAVAISRYNLLVCCCFSIGCTGRLPRRRLLAAPRNDSSFVTISKVNNNLAFYGAQQAVGVDGSDFDFADLIMEVFAFHIDLRIIGRMAGKQTILHFLE